MTERDDYADDISEDTAAGERDLSSGDKAALDDAAAARGQDGTTAEDLDQPVNPPIGAPDAEEEEAERANRLPGEQD